MRLRDLRVVGRYSAKYPNPHQRPATPVDVRDVLLTLGAEIHEVSCSENCSCDDQIEAWFPPGKYIVWRIPEKADMSEEATAEVGRIVEAET